MSKEPALNQERIEILEYIRSIGGTVQWPDLRRWGHHYMVVSSLARWGYLRKPAWPPYEYTITAKGRDALNGDAQP